MYKISVESYFSAAHHLRNYHGNCENVHGHNWRVLVSARYKDVGSSGMAIDFRELKKLTDEIVMAIDHKDLNDTEFFRDKNPTSENIARFIFDSVKGRKVPVESVTVFETDRYSASYSEES